MYKLNNFTKYHFIGILGSSMHNLALFLVKCGYVVSGSDKRYSREIATLKAHGVECYCGSDVSVVERCDCVVYTQAVSQSDEELAFAVNHGKVVLERAEFLQILAGEFNNVIAVSGTHGKTTVSALIGHILNVSGRKVFTHVGGDVVDVGEGFDTMVSEACEYKESFLHLRPNTGVILNVESDHPDYYHDIGEIYGAFQRFADGIKPSGKLVVLDGLDIKHNDKIVVGKDVVATDVTEEDGYCSFRPKVGDTVWERIRLKIPGLHNVTNALFALAVCGNDGVDRGDILCGLSTFCGVKRRFELVGEYNGAKVIVDYAHHPTEIKAVISTAKKMCRHLTVVFQPHTYSRTAVLFDEFLNAFYLADEVVIMKEYSARETPDMGKSAYDLFLSLDKSIRKRYTSCPSETLSVVKRYAYNEGIILFLGAGDVNKVAEYLV